MDPKKPPSAFTHFAKATADFVGRPISFWIAILIIVVWGVTGPLFHFSDTWQLVINTGTTIVTFLMVFLIQNTQNRDAEAIQIKLDELIRSRKGAHNTLLDLEEYDVEELHRVRLRYEKLAEQARQLIEHGGADTDSPDLPKVIKEEGVGVEKRSKKKNGSKLHSLR